MPASQRYTNLFSPGSFGSLQLKNRLVMAPMVTMFPTDTGAASEVCIEFLAERARGGVGLIVVEATYVDASGKGFACQLGLDRDALLPSHLELTEAVHRHGSKVAVQLHHGGRRANAKYTGGVTLAPSPIADAGFTMPRELTRDEIATLVQRFGEAAARAKLAGYDAVQIHGAHGYLLHQFVSPASNHRTDEYGGSLENRLRFTLEVIRSVREAVGPTYPVFYRLSAEGGYGIEESVTFAKEWEAAGIDALDVSIGGTAPITLVSPETSPMSIPQGYLADYSNAIKEAVSIPVMVVGEIRDPGVAEAILADGKADFIALARPLLADSFWAVKAAQGREADILKCVSCDHCRLGLRNGVPIRCLINPRMGRERWLREPEPTATPRKVMVVGAGPAGMETARVAALRGHHVSLYEAEANLGGGQLTLAEVPPFKDKLVWLREHLTHQMEKLPVDVHLGSRADASTVEREAPQVLVVAQGAVPMIPDIPGIGGDNVVTAHAILEGKGVPEGKRVAVLGGRQVGCETAEYLTQRGNTVTVVARSPASQLAGDTPYTVQMAMLKRMDKAGVQFIVEHDVKEIRGDGLALIGSGESERFLPVDVVVLARGAVSHRALADEVRDLVDEVHVIGDSVEPRTIAEAIYEGTLLGRDV